MSRCSSSGLALMLWAAMAAAVCGCGRPDTAPRVVVYSSVDEPVARPVLEAFQSKTGIRVVLVTDAEAAKTVGLAARLEAERNNPQADVYWGNEPFHTINLARNGVLAEYASPAAADIPAKYKDSAGRWASCGLRLRVIGLAAGGEAARACAAVKGVADLARPELRGRTGMARPSAGTTGGHVAALYVAMGEAAARRLLESLRDNGIRLLGGNSQVVRYIAEGQLWAGLTDNDDVLNARRRGWKVEMMMPDQEGPGTLAVPTTVAMVAGCRRSENARRLIDYLLSAETEKRLVDAGFAHCSVRVEPRGVRLMSVDYNAVAAKLPYAVADALRILEGRR